ncbi:gyf domain protein [Moniliophthora roreri MCA 2997]|nr:gyf domain protein [Moniliophthora roreri MCA 2997]
MYNDLPAQSHPHPSSSQFVPSQQIPTAVPDIFDARAQSQLPANNGTESVSVSPWGALDPPIAKRPGPFDPPHPTSSNTTVLPPLQTQPSPWGNVTEPSPSVSQTIEPTPVQSVSESIEPDSAVTDNVAEEVAIIKDEVVIEIPAEPSPEPEIQASPDPSEQLVAAATAVPPPVAEAPPPAPPPSTKSKAKPTSQPPVQASSPVEPITATAQTSPQPAAAAAPKAAWAKDDDAKKAATSLRQIQDAEAKKAEARKAVERERERAARANANATEDIQSFTTSWGLPTSQAGKSSVTVPPKETSAAAAAPTPTQQSPPAVWTTAAKSTAARPKTMKEIQEEEERRKKTAAVKEAPAVRRPYAESTNRAPPPTQGNAWTTVGPSGKAMSTANAPPRPPVQPSASTANSTSTPRVNGAPPAARPATSAAKPPPSNVSKAEDFPLPPSNDFMRWLADNMKGLNNTVNVEEIMSMLLSFPLDPDPSTTEIISDLIYANSTTLDGRRFAADFVSKRKADAVARSKNGAAGASSAKPISIADVVKAQPKPQTSEWGGFKVVNKKKKGGRS